MVICVAVDCKSDKEAREGLCFYKFPSDKNLKQQWLIKIKQKYLVNTTYQNMSCLLLRLKSRLEKDAVSAGPK